MTTVAPLLQSQNTSEFLFRGNAVAAGGFLTKLNDKPILLDPTTSTTHGESCLPWTGGVSHSLVENPELKFPQFISYGGCETYAEGRHDKDQTVTTVRASVKNVRLSTSPYPPDEAPGIQSITFLAESFSLELQSFYPQTGKASFKINPAVPVGMTLVIKDTAGKESTFPVTLDFDKHLLSFSSMEELDDAFLGDRQFFEEHAYRFPCLEKLVFGSSRIPRTPHGYVVTSFVRQIHVGNDVIPGHVLAKKGFGKIQFGMVLADSLNRRITMARVRMGSDPGGDASFSGVETNGIWQ